MPEEKTQQRKSPRPLVERYEELNRNREKAGERITKFENDVLAAAEKVKAKGAPPAPVEPVKELEPVVVNAEPIMEQPAVDVPDGNWAVDEELAKAKAATPESPIVVSPNFQPSEPPPQAIEPTTRNSGNPRVAAQDTHFVDGVVGTKRMPADAMMNRRRG